MPGADDLRRQFGRRGAAAALLVFGGTHTIRGESPDTSRGGNAFWMTRAEIGRTIQGTRPVLFGDVGWVGDRTRMRDIGRPLSGVGAGARFSMV